MCFTLCVNITVCVCGGVYGGVCVCEYMCVCAGARACVCMCACARARARVCVVGVGNESMRKPVGVKFLQMFSLFCKDPVDCCRLRFDSPTACAVQYITDVNRLHNQIPAYSCHRHSCVAGRFS